MRIVTGEPCMIMMERCSSSNSKLGWEMDIKMLVIAIRNK